MPPQPLSKVDSKSTIIIADGGAPRDAQIALAIFFVIDLWSQIDFQVAMLLAKIVDPKDAAEKLRTHTDVKSLRSRQENLRNTAKEALHPQDYCLIAAVMDEFKPSNNHRNDFCHGLWGTIAGKPDHFLLMEMEVAVDFVGTVISSAFQRTGEGHQFDRSKIKVWRARDFKEAVDFAKVAHKTFGLLSLAVGPMQQQHLREKVLSTGGIKVRYERFSSQQ